MADILTHVFRSFVSQRSRDVRVLLPSSGCSSTLVVGERSVNRSLLLLAALTTAGELGLRVLFLTQTQIQKLSAALQGRMSSLSPDNLKKIRFAYPRTVEELLQEIACLHESCAGAAVPPGLVIVDGLEGYLSGVGHQGEQASSAAHISALLCDTAAFLTKALEKATSGMGPCRVLLSFQSSLEGHAATGQPSAQDALLQILDRYFPLRCTLERDRNLERDAWQVYLSGTGVTEVTYAGGEKVLSLAGEWRLDMDPNGSMEFSVV